MIKWLAWKVISNYVAGETAEEAVQLAKNLEERGFSSTISLLGEGCTINESNLAFWEYILLIGLLEKKELNDCGISMKYTHLVEYNITRMFELIGRTRVNFPICLDMENYKNKRYIIDLYNKLKKQKKTSTVLQSRIRDSIEDIKQIDNVRICKGIYKESKDVSLFGEDVNSNFKKLVEHCVEENKYVSIATHDLDLIKDCEKILKEHKKCEFQFLYGVPIEEEANRLKESGQKVRYYIPYGKNWFQYCWRRAKENPNIVKHVIKNMFG